MRQVFILLVVGLTTAGAYWVGTRGLSLSAAGLRVAFGRMLECVGMTVIFFVANLAVAVTVIFVTRVLAGKFASIYLATDASLLVLSLLQGLMLQCWRGLESKRGRQEGSDK